MRTHIPHHELFSSRLRRLRMKAGYSQRVLSEILFASRDRVGQWETGYTQPRAIDLPKLAAVLGCSVDYLLTGQESPHSALHRAIKANVDA
jgi:transcriptional regulator with XRE-family HTH domain